MSSFFSITTNLDGKLVIPDVDYGTDDDMLSIPCSPETTCKSADEALIMSINRNGTVDLRFMSEISGLPTTSLISELAGKAIFQDPAVFETEKTWSPDREWLLSPQYLCGNIPAKLEQANRMEAKFPGCFQWNVNALRKLMPPTLGMEDIHVSLGAMWIPASIYAQFIRSLLRLPCYPEVVYQKELSRWMIQVKDAGHNSVLNKVIYGTEVPTDVEVTLAGTTETTAAIGIADYAREVAGRGGLGVVAPVGGIHPAVTIVHDAGEYLGHTHSSGL